MGCCSSSPTPRVDVNDPNVNPDKTRAANTEIGSSMKNAERRERSIKKLLLLGTGSSGKSTLFKSLRCINEGGFDDSELSESRHVIRQNCVAGILTILKKSQELYDEDPQNNAPCLVNMDDEIVSAIQMVVNFGSESFTEALDYKEVLDLGNCVHMLWSLDAVRATFSRRGNKFSFPDNMDYFFGKVKTIMTENYLPSSEDMLKARVRTTGMIEYVYEVKDNIFNIYDVGGQRNERKKWIHSFENVAAVLFVTALNHYHAVLFEDEKKNAMHEAVELFTEICNSKWFRKSEMILFLNKDDLFKETLKNQIRLNECFSHQYGWNGKQWEGPDYCPKDNMEEDEKHFVECYEETIKFIQDVFIARNQIQNRVVFCHVTCATDQDTVEKVFWDVQNIVIRSNLRRGGLMV